MEATSEFGSVLWDGRRNVCGRSRVGIRCGRPGISEWVERGFWNKIAEGDLPRECAVAVDVSLVAGTRWFRDAGGTSP